MTLILDVIVTIDLNILLISKAFTIFIDALLHGSSKKKAIFSM